jgi:hypothetical protein
VSDRSGGLPRLSLLRTVLATFTAYGSSTLKVTRLPGNPVISFLGMSSFSPLPEVEPYKPIKVTEVSACYDVFMKVCPSGDVIFIVHPVL